MKINLALLLIIFCLVSMGADAQKFRLNLSAGTDVAAGAVAGTSGGIISSRIGVGGGLDLEMNCSPVISLQLGAHYSQQGYGFIKETGEAGTAGLNYVTIPLLIRLKATPNLYFLAGPQAGILMTAKAVNNGAPSVSSKDGLASTDYYAVFGAGCRFANNIFVDARYHYGFNNIAKDLAGDLNVTNRYFSFRIGYGFPLGKK